MADINMTATPKPWANKAFYVLAIICALTEIISPRAAQWISEKACSLIARYGITVEVAND
jgi:hypothetical protein